MKKPESNANAQELLNANTQELIARLKKSLGKENLSVAGIAPEGWSGDGNERRLAYDMATPVRPISATPPDVDSLDRAMWNAKEALLALAKAGNRDALESLHIILVRACIELQDLAKSQPDLARAVAKPSAYWPVALSPDEETKKRCFRCLILLK